jgi:FMN-dependent NADH-azoreductase
LAAASAANHFISHTKLDAKTSLIGLSEKCSLSPRRFVATEEMKLAHVLYIEASPRKLRSASIEVAHVLAAWRKADPKLTVDTLDVWSTKLPEFDGPLMEAKYAGLAGTPLTKEQDSAWSSLSELAERFKAADALVFAVPLWNFGIPYKLKHLIDW